MAKRGRSKRSPKTRIKGNVKGLCHECSGPVNVERHWFIKDPNGLHHYGCSKYLFDSTFPRVELEEYFDEDMGS